jgi:Na+-transporting methylmalonyl-CoA/oxaloacetate decarboxylase beta subunit
VDSSSENGSQSAAVKGLKQFYQYTGFNNATSGHLIMILVGLFFIFLAIRYNYEPLLLIPIGTGILIGNIPFMLNAGLTVRYLRGQ